MVGRQRGLSTGRRPVGLATVDDTSKKADRILIDVARVAKHSARKRRRRSSRVAILGAESVQHLLEDLQNAGCHPTCMWRPQNQRMQGATQPAWDCGDDEGVADGANQPAARREPTT